MEPLINKLESKSCWVRRQILEMIVAANKGHIGGALSCTDILVTLYYGGILKFDSGKPDWNSRDRFVLSKGHSCQALYPILADLGFFPLAELQNFCKGGSILGGHPDRNIPGVEVETGSLGQGLGIAAGLALGTKIDKKDYLTIALLGDGECFEGSIWEAAMFAGHHQLNNLIAIIDRNKLCATDFTDNCGQLEPLADKWKAFGWDVKGINGHNFNELVDSFSDLRTRKSTQPLVIIADTIKGKGISFMEGTIECHHGVPSGENLNKARQELAVL